MEDNNDNNEFGIFIQGRWQLGQMIAEGGYGCVWTATDIFNGHEVAVKMMEMAKHLEDSNGNLEEEAAALRAVHGSTPGGKRGIPRVVWDGQEEEYYVLITELLGPSLDDLMNYCSGKFSERTTLMVADQAVSLLQIVHESGWVHRDIKPHNFLLGTGIDGNLLHSIDMGLSKEWKEADLDRKRLGNLRNNFIGTPDFASLNSHKGIELTYRDDLESFGYVLILMLTKELPWSPLGDKDEWSLKRIKAKKTDTSLDELCKDVPDAIREYFLAIAHLGFAERPDYDELRGIFRRGLETAASKKVKAGGRAIVGTVDDEQFDWTKRMWRELYHAGGEAAALFDPPFESESV